jgi:hypothetical protein
MYKAVSPEVIDSAQPTEPTHTPDHQKKKNQGNG